MNYAFYILPVLLAVSIPSALAEVGQNYDTVINEDGTVTWTSHPERIMDQTWKNYFLTETNDKVIFNSNSVGSLVFDKNSCSYSIYENGFVSPETQIIPSVSAVATFLDDETWQNMNVNNETCFVEVESFEDSITITSTKENDLEKFQQELILSVFDGFKETFYIYDNSNSGNQLGVSQTVHVGESIFIGGEEIRISDFDGMSFDKDFIIENRAEILQLTDSINYDFDKGIDSLTSVNIIHDESFLNNTYKINLDYSDGSFVGYLEIDPTFTNSSPTVGRLHSTWQGGTSCSTGYSGTDSSSGFQLKRSAISGACSWAYWAFDLSSIGSSNVISSATFGLSIGGYGDYASDVEAKDCRWEYSDDNTAGSSMFSDFRNSSYTIETNNECEPKNTTMSMSLPSSHFSTMESEFGDTWVIGMNKHPYTRIGDDIYGGFSNPSLEIVYSTPTPPDAITDLSATYNSPNMDLSWTLPNAGSSSITSFKIYRDTGSGFSLYDTVSSSTLTTYQDTNPVIGTTNFFKVNAVNSISEASDSNTASAVAGTPPGIPTGVTSTIQDTDNAPLDVFLQWSSPVSWGSGVAQGFEVYRNGVLVTTTGLVNSYTDTVTTPGANSHYIKSVSSHGSSANSNTVNITTPSVPDAITDLSGNIISDTQINLSFTAPNDGGSNIDLYKIFKDGSQVDTTTNTTYSLTGLTSNTSYAITVFANNSVGDSLVSNTVNLTTYQTVSGSITVTPNTQGASTQLTFSTSGITGTPTPTFNTFTLKEGITVIASGITSPYTLALNDNSPHTYTVTSTDNTHWDTPTISGNTTVTATYDPNWSNNISYNYTRANGVIDLTVNKDSQSLWDASCNYKTTAQVMADQSGIVSNFTNVWYINDNQTISDTDTLYVSCTDDGTTLFSFTSFGPNRLGGGIALLDDTFEGMIGTPVALIFVLLVAGLFTGRSAPTGILLVLALIGVLGFIGMLTIDEAVWGFLLLAGVLGIFLGKRFL